MPRRFHFQHVSDVVAHVVKPDGQPVGCIVELRSGESLFYPRALAHLTSDDLAQVLGERRIDREYGSSTNEGLGKTPTFLCRRRRSSAD